MVDHSSSADDNATCSKQCCSKSPEAVVRLLGILCALSIITMSIVSIVSLDGAQYWILYIYLIVLSFVTLVSEIRFVECCRKMTFSCVKWIYCVSGYIGRGILYIFMGLTVMRYDEKKIIFYLTIALGITTISVGVANILLYIICRDRLVQYEDPQMAKILGEAEAGNLKPAAGRGSTYAAPAGAAAAPSDMGAGGGVPDANPYAAAASRKSEAKDYPFKTDAFTKKAADRAIKSDDPNIKAAGYAVSLAQENPEAARAIGSAVGKHATAKNIEKAAKYLPK